MFFDFRLDEFRADVAHNELRPDLPGPQFFIPRMLDRPQNPIFDSLKSVAKSTSLKPEAVDKFALSTELHSLLAQPAVKDSKLWSTEYKTVNASQAVSWDALHPMHSTKASPGSLLSEQESRIFASARYQVMSNFQDEHTDGVHVSQSTLLRNLKVTSLGFSSMLHTWDHVTERFVASNAKDRKSTVLVDGKDAIITESIMAPFLTIGTLLRRMEVLIQKHRESSFQDTTTNSFFHALSSTISYVRDSISRCPPSNDDGYDNLPLSALLLRYLEYSEILVALAAFCDREESKIPSQYSDLRIPAHLLLSRIHQHLERHLEQQSGRHTTAIFAYILTTVSHEYLQTVSQSVGLGGCRSSSLGDQHLGEDGLQEINYFSSCVEHFPLFFPTDLVATLPAAQRSLTLLQAAYPDHNLLKAPANHFPLRWIWTESDVEAALDDRPIPPASSSIAIPVTLNVTRYRPEMRQFSIFDLDPGGHEGDSFFGVNFTTSATSQLQRFIDVFPETLPISTPTLSQLTRLVLKPLLLHASTVSTTLLSLFLSPSASINVPQQMDLLRSYLLLTSPAFRSRLQAALFSDSVDSEPDSRSHALQNLRRNPPTNSVRSSAVGLAPALLDRNIWPPVGGDLSFLLRTVIVDTVQSGIHEQVEDEYRQRLVEETENRLGFAIRDLPATGSWTNPRSIEALDFLYMDYKAPKPLDVIITSDVLSQYQRMFIFLLRLLRAENAVRALFRMTKSFRAPLFPTLTASNKRLLHFRFVAHSFVSGLASYVFDTAIGGNFDVFLSKMKPRGNSPPPFSDIFALAKEHSALLNDILSACLMRSSQKVVKNLLLETLEMVLECATTMGELREGRLQEYQAAPLLDDLYDKFRGKTTSLMKALKSSDKYSALDLYQDLNSSREQGHRAPGGTEALSHLLLRWDTGNWWSGIDP